MNIKGAPAIWAMLISAQIIFSLSFDMWQADVVMIYTMLFVLLRVCVGCNSRGGPDRSLVSSNVQCFLIVNSSVGALSYVFNRLFFL